MPGGRWEGSVVCTTAENSGAKDWHHSGLKKERCHIVPQQTEQRCELVTALALPLSPPPRTAIVPSRPELGCHSCYSQPFENGETVGPPDPDSSHPDDSLVTIWSL